MRSGLAYSEICTVTSRPTLSLHWLAPPVTAQIRVAAAFFEQTTAAAYGGCTSGLINTSIIRDNSISQPAMAQPEGTGDRPDITSDLPFIFIRSKNFMI